MNHPVQQNRGGVAVVTGAGAGIGRAISLRLADDHATVVVTDRHEGRMSETVEAVRAKGGTAVGLLLDIEARSQFDDVFGRVERDVGAIGTYVWNAALNVQQPIFEYDPELFDRILYANVNNCWYSTNVVVEQMKRNGGGSIVMIGSIAPDTAATEVEPPYGISKAAVRALVLGVAKAGGPFGIRCNEVIMGLVTGTRFTDTQPEKAAAYLPRVPLGRHVTAEEIAEATAFLVSDRAASITGEVLNVSGGMLMRM
jgi:NAD(P)-dependent dehydrogenase (short-subunit alcohol dehydrogenase family)